MTPYKDGSTHRVSVTTFAEFLDTNGRRGLRLTDRLGQGVLLEPGPGLDTLIDLLQHVQNKGEE